MKPMNLVIGAGAAFAAWWAWDRWSGGDGGSGGEILPAVVTPSTPGTTPVQTNSVPNTDTPDTVLPAPPALPPAGYATLDPVGGVPNFSQYIANTVGPGRQALSADEWNWYFSQFSGVPQTADLFTPDNRGETISITEYMSRRTAAGLSGLRFPAAGNYYSRGVM